MPTTEPRPSNQEGLQVRLAAIDKLIEEAEKLISAQEQEVDRMRAAGLDTRHAQGLLEAYRASARIAVQERRELQNEIARRGAL